MALFLITMSCFSVIFTLASAMPSPSKEAVEYFGTFFIKESSNAARHFIPSPTATSSLVYAPILGIPNVGHRWSMWKSTRNPRMRIFGIQIGGSWYFLQIRRSATGQPRVILFQGNEPRMVMSDSVRWFEYGKFPPGKAEILYHKKTRLYLTTNSNQVSYTDELEQASGVSICAE